MAETLENLYYDFSLKYRDKTDDYFIDFYKSNALFFNNITTVKDIEALRMYMQITCRYANALFNKGRFNECIDTCDKNLLVINNEILRLNADEVKDDWYYYILFAKGKSCYNLKDYKNSKLTFKNLSNHDPDNEKYKNWFNDSKYMQFDKYVILTTIILFVLLATSYIGKVITFPTIVRVVILILATLSLILMLGLFAYTFFLKRNLRKKTR